APAVGWSRPASRLNRVDLPQPEGPMTATNSPSATSRSSPSRARTPPERDSNRLASRVARSRTPELSGWSGTGRELVGGELGRVVRQVQDLRLLRPGQVLAEDGQVERAVDRGAGLVARLRGPVLGLGVGKGQPP